ncbi:hypothetical protein THAOC_13090 [Thalassiosira oceanica]|uniref:Uncharacterized protein n=1 Tax=Thalassiosira oceanica TaxID=159749 RepID=K0T6E1_THAOC|nr:hypothetical protein THAOC_13090 [Thalassiosira oceanica]|eukprot:EJK66012.1 hypothetical protein THAOC_13090 [Thalassiosira oceanica]
MRLANGCLARWRSTTMRPRAGASRLVVGRIRKAKDRSNIGRQQFVAPYLYDDGAHKNVCRRVLPPVWSGECPMLLSVPPSSREAAPPGVGTSWRKPIVLPGPSRRTIARVDICCDGGGGWREQGPSPLRGAVQGYREGLQDAPTALWE